MAFDPGQDTCSDAAILAETNGNGADAAARDLLFVEQLKFGQAELASESLFFRGLVHDSIATARHDAEACQVDIVISRCDRVVSSRRGDRRRLIQAFDHLIRNALQYTSNGGTIQVRGMLLDQRFLIEIEDAGPGIPPDERESIYDAFFRGTNATEYRVSGRGIGLTVARAIIEAHGGSLRVHANDEVGTTAYVELPA